MKLANLNKEDSLRLMKFVCSFAWADLEVADQERSFVHKMMKKLKLDDAGVEQVKQWLVVPPRVEEIDPNEVPAAHRKIFLEAAQELASADGNISEEERENLSLLEQLLG